MSLVRSSSYALLYPKHCLVPRYLHPATLINVRLALQYHQEMRIRGCCRNENLASVWVHLTHPAKFNGDQVRWCLVSDLTQAVPATRRKVGESVQRRFRSFGLFELH